MLQGYANTMSEHIDFIAHESAIVAAADAHEKTNEHRRDYSQTFSYQGYFIKFGSGSPFESEIETQKYLAERAAVDQQAPRIANIYHFFVWEGRMAYAVMEWIDLVPDPGPGDLAVKAAEAVTWMQSVKAPEGLAFGPIGSGRARHVLFQDHDAPPKIKDVGALGRFFNQAIAVQNRFLPSSMHVADVAFANEALVLTQSDMHPSNFGVDKDGRPVLLDFGDVGWLPSTFGIYTLLRSTVAAEIYTAEERERLLASPNQTSISMAGRVTRQTTLNNLGLNEDCYPKVRTRNTSDRLDVSQKTVGPSRVV